MQLSQPPHSSFQAGPQSGLADFAIYASSVGLLVRLSHRLPLLSAPTRGKGAERWQGALALAYAERVGASCSWNIANGKLLANRPTGWGADALMCTVERLMPVILYCMRLVSNLWCAYTDDKPPDYRLDSHRPPLLPLSAPWDRSPPSFHLFWMPVVESDTWQALHEICRGNRVPPRWDDLPIGCVQPSNHTVIQHMPIPVNTRAIILIPRMPLSDLCDPCESDPGDEKMSPVLSYAFPVDDAGNRQDSTA